MDSSGLRVFDTCKNVPDKEEEKQAVEEKMRALDENAPEIKAVRLSAITKRYIYESSIGLAAIVAFIAIYLGIIFLIPLAGYTSLYTGVYYQTC